MKQKQLKQEEVSELDDDIGDLTESKEQVSTFLKDMYTIVDFQVSDSTVIMTRLLQRVPIGDFYSFHEHKKQSLEEQKEALDLLDLLREKYMTVNSKNSENKINF